MIRERHTGNPLFRLFSTAIGYGDLYREYAVPDILNHRIVSSDGIVVRLVGVPINLSVTCETPSGSFPFSAVVPEGATFSLQTSDERGYQSRLSEKKIFIPRNTRYQMLTHPAETIIHEGGHLWRGIDQEWCQRLQEADNILQLELASRQIWGYISLPDDPREREQHLEAWKVLGEEERRSSAISVYTIGRLRKRGFDPLPQQSNESIAKTVNKGLKSHDKLKLGLCYTPDEIGYFLAGNLPIPIIGETVASYLDKSLSDI